MSASVVQYKQLARKAILFMKVFVRLEIRLEFFGDSSRDSSRDSSLLSANFRDEKWFNPKLAQEKWQNYEKIGRET